MEDVQQLSVGTTLDHRTERNGSERNRTGQVSVRTGHMTSYLIGDDVQLYDTARPGRGLLADDVKHFTHQFLSRHRRL